MITAPATVRKVEIASQRRAVAASALVSALAVVLCVITPSAASAQQPGQFDDRSPDPNVPPLAAPWSPAALPLWWQIDYDNTGKPKMLRSVVFAKDHSLGAYLGYDAQGSWIVHEDGTVYVYEGKTGSLSARGIAPAGIPADLVVGEGAGPAYPRRANGIVTRSPDGGYSLRYRLIEEGKSPRTLVFRNLCPADGAGRWGWIGSANEADPAAVDAVNKSADGQSIRNNAPGEPIGSAGIITVTSAGGVDWLINPKAVVALSCAHGEGGRIVKTQGGAYRLNYILVEPGKANRPKSLPVARSKLIMSPQLERALTGSPTGSGLAFVVASRIDPANAWIWFGSDGNVQAAAIYSVAANGGVRWFRVDPLIARIFRDGYTPADVLDPAGTQSKASTPNPPLPGAADDPYLPRPASPDGPFGRPLSWRYLHSSIPQVWMSVDNAYQPTGLVNPTDGEVVYLGFNAEGSWLEGPLDGRIYRWDGKALTAPLRNLADVPAGLRNPSEFMVRYAAQRASAGQTPSPIRASTAAAGSSDTDAQDPLLVHDTAPTSFTATTGSVIHGSGARVKSGMLTFTDVATGAKTTLRVARPAYLSAQMAAMAQLGASGPWIWVSEDHQQGRLISVETNGSVTATVVPGANALGMLPSAAPN